MKNIPRFQAQSLSDEESRSQFVVRKKEFELVMSDIRTDNMEGSIQHYIFVGQRGSGKSTLLRRIQAEINTDKGLKENLVAVNLSEEQAGIYRLHDLWFKVNEALIHNGFDIIQPDWQQYGTDHTAYARDLYLAMQQALKKQGKKVVLLLDNIDRVLGHIKTGDNHLFRELLMNYKDVRIIGGSTKLSEHYWKYDQPFYQFFRIIRLEPLTQKEMEELLSHWSDSLETPQLKEVIKKGIGKLNAVRILSDGMPRTILNLLELLVVKPDEHGYDYLKKIMDDASPIYQERLGTLSDLLGKVLLELSFYWDAVDVKHLSETARIESAMLSSLLNKLVKLKIVDKRKGKGKNYYYLVHERFFNLWLIMTQGGPKQKSELKAMTVFLEVIYNEDELKQFASNFIKELSAGNICADKAIIQAKGLMHSKYITSQQRDELIDRIEKMAADNKDYIDLLPPKTKEIYAKVSPLVESGKYDAAIDRLNVIEQEDAQKDFILGYIYHRKGALKEAEIHYLKIKDRGNVEVLNNLAGLYLDQNKLEQAKEYYQLAMNKGEKSKAPFNIAILYTQQEKFEEAEKYYLLAIDHGHVGALNNLAGLYAQQGKINDAKKYYLKAIENGLVVSLTNLGNLYVKESDFKNAEKYYQLALEKGDKFARNNIANIFFEQGNFADAEKHYLMAVENGDKGALANLGNLYLQQNNLEQAEKYYLLSIENGNISIFDNLAFIYKETGRFEDAEKYCLKAIENGHTPSLNNLAMLYNIMGRDEDAEKYYSMAIDKGVILASYNLAVFLFQKNRDPKRAIESLSRFKEIFTPNLGQLMTEKLIYLWAGHPEILEDAIQLLQDAINKNEISDLQEFMEKMLSHHQKNTVWKWFHEKELGDKLREMLKPLYFVTARLLDTAEAKEVLLTQPPELNEPIEKLYQQIMERQKFYYTKEDDERK